MENKETKTLSIQKVIVIVGIIVMAVWLISTLINNNNTKNKYDYTYSESEIIAAAKKKALANSVIETNDLTWTTTKIVERDDYGRLIVDLQYEYTGSSSKGEVLVNIWEADNFYRCNIKTVRDSSNRDKLIQQIKDEGHWNQPISNNL